MRFDSGGELKLYTMAKKTKTYWTKVANQYEKIITTTKDMAHKKLCKHVLKNIINPKIKAS